MSKRFTVKEEKFTDLRLFSVYDNVEKSYILWRGESMLDCDTVSDLLNNLHEENQRLKDEKENTKKILSLALTEYDGLKEEIKLLKEQLERLAKP